MLTRTEKRVAVAVIVPGLLLLAAAVAVVVRWADVQAWLDAPDVLRVNDAALEVALPPGFEEDATRTACAHQGALRCAWAAVAPQAAVADVAARLRALDIDVEDVLCGDVALPPAAIPGSSIACGARVPVRDAELWVLATDVTPEGGVPLGRTAVWFAWDTVDMSWPLYERVAAAHPYPYSEEAFPVASRAEVAAALPPRYEHVLGTCWRTRDEDVSAPCQAWQGTIDASDLPADAAVEGLARELTAAGFFVDAADAAWGGAPLTAHRFVRPGGWSGLSLSVQLTDDELVARLVAL